LKEEKSKSKRLLVGRRIGLLVRSFLVISVMKVNLLIYTSKGATNKGKSALF
jgi:hypothetical protein